MATAKASPTSWPTWRCRPRATPRSDSPADLVRRTMECWEEGRAEAALFSCDGLQDARPRAGRPSGTHGLGMDGLQGRTADDADSFPSGHRSLRSTPSAKTVGITAAGTTVPDRPTLNLPMCSEQIGKVASVRLGLSGRRSPY